MTEYSLLPVLVVTINHDAYITEELSPTEKEYYSEVGWINCNHIVIDSKRYKLVKAEAAPK